MIRFDSVTKTYPDGTVAVDNLSFTAPSGKITVLVGPSGCGKTTSLRMINRMIEPTSGRIWIDDRDHSTGSPTELRRGIGYVIQHAGLFPHRTIVDNVATVPLLLGQNKREARAQRAGVARARRPARELREALPGTALRRAAAARRRRPRARRRPAGDVDGRAVQRGRPRRARAAAERVPATAERAQQNDRLRHARHRRGDQARRPGRCDARRRQTRAARDAGRPALQSGRRFRGRLRRSRPWIPGTRVRARYRPETRSRNHRAARLRRQCCGCGRARWLGSRRRRARVAAGLARGRRRRHARLAADHPAVAAPRRHRRRDERHVPCGARRRVVVTDRSRGDRRRGAPVCRHHHGRERSPAPRATADRASAGRSSPLQARR